MSLRCRKSEHKDAPLLVWFSEIQWDFLSTRKQRLLQRFPPEWKILFIEPFTLGRRHHWFPVMRGGVRVVSVPFLKNVPSGLAFLVDAAPVRWMVAFFGRLWMQFWVRLLGFGSHERIIGLSNIFWGRIVSQMPCRLRFYDANDDHLAFTRSPRWLRDCLRSYLDASDLVLYVSPELLEGLQPLREGVRCVELGNGVEFSHFATPVPGVPAKMAELVAAGKPLLGYAGAMDWIDTALVEATARAWPEYEVVLIGPAYARDWWQNQSALRALPNVQYFGKVPYRDLPGYVQRFSLALMPLLKGPEKRVSHPNKLYEYTAAGVPVLAIDYCSAVERARPVVTAAHTHEEFVGLVPAAMADPGREARQAFARRHSWDGLAALMVRVLGECVDRNGR